MTQEKILNPISKSDAELQIALKKISYSNKNPSSHGDLDGFSVLYVLGTSSLQQTISSFRF